MLCYRTKSREAYKMANGDLGTWDCTTKLVLLLNKVVCTS